MVALERRVGQRLLAYGAITQRALVVGTHLGEVGVEIGDGGEGLVTHAGQVYGRLPAVHLRPRVTMPKAWRIAAYQE